MTERFGYHVVLTTHNSRTSQRMKVFNIRKKEPLLLTTHEEIVLTKIIGSIIKGNDYRCLGYNICQDHVHLLLVCESDHDLQKTVQKLKSMSSKLFHRSDIRKDYHHKVHQNRLWSQKFFRAYQDEYKLSKISGKPGQIYVPPRLTNTINYIKTNRVKHRLEHSIELEKVTSDFTMSIEDGYNDSNGS